MYIQGMTERNHLIKVIECGKSILTERTEGTVPGIFKKYPHFRRGGIQLYVNT